MKRIPVAVYYYMSFFFIPCLGLIQTKVLTHILSPSLFGEMQLIIPIFSWCVIIAGIGLPQFVVRFYEGQGIKVFNQGLCISSLFGFALVSISFVLAKSIGIAIPGFQLTVRMVMVLLLAVLAGQASALVKSLLRVQERHVFYNLVVGFEKILTVIAVISAVYWMIHSPGEGFLLGSAMGVGAMLLLVTIFYRGKLLWKFSLPSWEQVKGMFVYGFPISIIILMGDFLPNLNRYVIASELNTSDVASYSISCMIASLYFQSLCEPLLTFIHPRVFKAWELSDTADAENIVNRYLNYYVVSGILICGLVISCAEYLINLVANESYRMPSGSFTILILANFLLGVYRFLSTHYYLTKKTLELGFCYFLAVLLNFVAAVMLIEKFGLRSIAGSILLGASVLTFIVWFRGRKVLKIKIPVKKYLLVVPIALIMGLVPPTHAWNLHSSWRWFDVAGSSGIVLLWSWISILKIRTAY